MSEAGKYREDPLPEGVSSDNIDLFDFGRIAFVDCEVYSDPVPLEGD